MIVVVLYLRLSRHYLIREKKMKIINHLDINNIFYNIFFKKKINSRFSKNFNYVIKLYTDLFLNNKNVCNLLYLDCSIKLIVYKYI
jgi:hypothetical protein